jgi:hypothetical protein
MIIEVQHVSNWVYSIYKKTTGKLFVSQAKINLLTYIVFQEYLKMKELLLCDCEWYLSEEGLPVSKKIVDIDSKFPKPYFKIKDNVKRPSWLGFMSKKYDLDFKLTKDEIYFENLIYKYRKYSVESLTNRILMNTALQFSELNPGDKIDSDLIYNSKSFNNDGY